MNAFDIITQYRSELLYGLSVTLKLCIFIWSIGILVGTAIGAAGAHWRIAVGWPTRVISFVLSGVPVLVLLFWLHYPAQYELGIVVNPFITAVVTLSIVNVFSVADIVMGVLREFPNQYVQAAKACGLTPRQTIIYIEMPIVVREIIPTVLSMQVVMLQGTLFASLISVDELFRVAQRINSEIYRPVEIYTALALFFISICLPMYGLSIWMKRRFTRNISER